MNKLRDTKLVGEIVEVLAHDIERPLRFGFASPRTTLA
jgi:hypothetical protein